MICYNCKNQLSDAYAYDKCPFCGTDLRPGAKKVYSTKETHIKESLIENRKVLKMIPFLEIFPLFGFLASIFLFFSYSWWFGLCIFAVSFLIAFLINSLYHLGNGLKEILNYLEKSGKDESPLESVDSSLEENK